MNSILQTSLVIVFLLSFGKSLHAQQRTMDSTHRKLMMDSLRVRDTVINEIFNLREAYLRKTVRIRTDSSMNQSQQRNALALIRRQTNFEIKLLLGDAKFEKYVQMIRSRMRTRNPTGSTLAGDGG